MPHLKRQNANGLVLDADGGPNAGTGVAVGAAVIGPERAAEIPWRARRAVGDDDVAVAARLVQAALRAVFGEEREMHFIVPHDSRAHAAKISTNLRNIRRLDKHGKEIVDSLETPSVNRRAVAGRHARPVLAFTARTPGAWISARLPSHDLQIQDE